MQSLVLRHLAVRLGNNQWGGKGSMGSSLGRIVQVRKAGASEGVEEGEVTQFPWYTCS